MKHFSLNTLLCTIVVASIAIAPCESDDKLITQTCSKTPYPSQCFGYIKAVYDSKDVRDVPGLGIIMAEVLELKAQDPKDILFVLLGMGKRPDIQAQLKTCLESYSFIINSAMPAAIDSFKIGKPRLAEDYANTAALVVSKCEKSFNGKSPITNENNITREIARILGAIAKQL